MLILAGVSISAMVGEDGVLTKAKAASIASRKASILEELNMELASYNIDAILKSPEETTTMLGNLISKGLIDTVLSSSEEYVAEATSPMGIPQFDDANNYTGYIDYAVKKEDYSIIISIDDSGIYKAEYGDVTISAGGSVAGGTTLVTDKAFTNNEGATAEEQGKFVIDNDASVMFVDEISGELSIQVKSGTNAKVYAFKDMTLTNSGIKRSAIDIEPGGTLDLFVAEGATVTVNSGLGEIGDTGNFMKNNEGGYAGIHVPIEATLNLHGNGYIKSIGGDAGDGNTYLGNTSSSQGGSGGGGAGAGIGGNGGYGSGYVVGKGSNGGNGEGCGNIFIYNDLKVYAYGGAGGSGADGTVENGGGAGGYPAAGIGGGGAGGAGGTCCAGGGGYSGGGADGYVGWSNSNSTGNRGYGAIGGKNGNRSETLYNSAYWALGGFGYNILNTSELSSIAENSAISYFAGGMGGVNMRSSGHFAGNGGTAGNGGNVCVSTNANIYAYNGNKYTDDTPYSEGLNQLTIYAQDGIINARYVVEDANTNFTYTIEQIHNDSGIEKTNYINSITNSCQGIGSGAGYIEVSNGTYTIDSSMN